MTNQTTENFLNVMANFEWPQPSALKFYLYYNDDGTPKCYSMEQLPDKYVEVDAETFARRPWNIKVVAGQIEFIRPVITVQKLQPSTKSGTPCDPQDVCVIVSDQQPHIKWNQITNEIS